MGGLVHIIDRHYELNVANTAIGMDGGPKYDCTNGLRGLGLGRDYGPDLMDKGYISKPRLRLNKPPVKLLACARAVADR